MSDNIIQDVITRTSGELYLGVVGSVRSGKSTFIRKFMEIKVLPNIHDKQIYQKVLDELPQSGEGRAIMTVEPKFIPSDQVKININENISFKTRLIDCVGYVIPTSTGYLNEDGSSRLVQTPWFSEGIPFNEAATIGTQKVIENHANIGIVVTSDGSFGSFTREEYEVIEEKVISELQALNKPFIIVLNTVHPGNEETKILVNELKTKYHNSVVAVDVKNIQEKDIDDLLKEALNEFDIDQLSIKVPNWVDELDDTVSFKQKFNAVVGETTANYRKMKDVFSIQESLIQSDLFEDVEVEQIDPATGLAELNVKCSDQLYFELIEEIIGEPIENKGNFMKILQSFKEAKRVYELIGKSIDTMEQRGYDVAIPSTKDMRLATPELIKQGSRYGIKIKAIAPSIELVKIDIESTFEPIIGSEAQAQALISHMLENYEKNPDELWNSEIFGRKLGDVICDGIYAKVHAVDDSVQLKYKDALEKVINYGKGGIIAIMI